LDDFDTARPGVGIKMDGIRMDITDIVFVLILYLFSYLCLDSDSNTNTGGATFRQKGGHGPSLLIENSIKQLLIW
jgi:hypothetical protein